MNVTTIAFTSSTSEAPQYVFGDRVAVKDMCEPQYWATGRVVGLRIDEVYQPGWWYTVQLDLPNGFAEEYVQIDLIPEAQIPTLQEQWRLKAYSQLTSLEYLSEEHYGIHIFDLL